MKYIHRFIAFMLERFTQFQVLAWLGDRERIAGIGVSNYKKYISVDLEDYQ